jgi:hypothetical protein
LQTYDRAVIKIAPELLLAANRTGLPETPQKIILPSGLFGRAKWKYTFTDPGGDWTRPDFDATNWKEGVGGFGTSGTPGIFVNTIWSSADIWLRSQINLEAEDIPRIKLHIFHDEDCEVYLNGARAVTLPRFITDYELFDISSAALSALKPGANTIAVHCHQTSGGQGIDVGIFIPQPEARKTIK